MHVLGASLATLATGPATWTGSLPTWILVVVALACRVADHAAAAAAAVDELNRSREQGVGKGLWSVRSETATGSQASKIAALESKTDVVAGRNSRL